MWWVVIMCGALFSVMGVAGLVAPLVSERRRQIKEILGVTPAQQLLLVLAGGVLALGGVLANLPVCLLGFAGLGACAAWSKRRMAQVEDPPPMMARVQQRSLNPLASILHPIRSAKQDAELYKVRRNRREQHEWEVRRGLRPPPDEP